MCGFAGFIDFTNRSERDHLEKMTNSLAHRGPDAADFHLNIQPGYSLGFGHRRLSVIDLNACSNQPMHLNDLTIVYNGEVYNYKEIKKKLEKLGRVFKTSSDTEVILQSFDEWGESCVHHFIGMFVFVIFDKKKEKITVFTDRPGVKPFYYYWHENLFLFASEIKAFHEHPHFQKKLDTESIAQFLQYGYIPSPNSIFEDVRKLMPGNILSFTLKTKTLKTKCYWNVDTFYEKEKLKLDFEEAKKETEVLLSSACNYRMVSDVPVGVFLSGGYDSSLVTAILQKSNTQKIKTFTIGVEDPNLNEAKFAKETAAYLGTDHTEIYCKEQELIELIDSVAFYYDEPFGDSSAIPTMLVSKMAKNHVTVALSADGGDEVFGGYERYNYISKFQQLKNINRIPLPYNSLINFLIKDNYQAERVKSLFNDATPERLADSLNIAFTHKDLQQIFKKEISKPIWDFEHLKNKNIHGDLSRMMAYDYKTYLLNDILPKVDRATMSASLEGREPLLDHRLMEFAAQLPESYKINNGLKKYILREITHSYIPKEMMERKKMGFAVPVKKWLHGVLKDKIDYYSGVSFLEKQDIFNVKNIQNLIQEIRSGKEKRYEKLWYFLMFQLWYEKWMM